MIARAVIVADDGAAGFADDGDIALTPLLATAPDVVEAFGALRRHDAAEDTGAEADGRPRPGEMRHRGHRAAGGIRWLSGPRNGWKATGCG